MNRNGFSREQVLAIIARQATREARLAAADDVIDNDNTTLDALKAQVDSQHRTYLSLAGG
jgi:dephospho-CoA kinase